MSLSQACGEGESFANIRLLDVGEIGKQLFDGAAGCHRLDDHTDGDPHAADAWLSAHDFGIHRYPFELVHAVMIAQGDVWLLYRSPLNQMNRNQSQRRVYKPHCRGADNFTTMTSGVTSMGFKSACTAIESPGLDSTSL